jgi:hypothetical protein
MNSTFGRRDAPVRAVIEEPAKGSARRHGEQHYPLPARDAMPGQSNCSKLPSSEKEEKGGDGRKGHARL